MPIKRRTSKHRDFKITDAARAVFKTARGEKICIYRDGSGLICNSDLAAALGLPELITLRDMRTLADELSRNIQPLDGENPKNVRFSTTRKRQLNTL
jgi:hypothetical protein